MMAFRVYGLSFFLIASLIFSIASSKVSPWLWHPGRAGQCTSNPYSVLFMTTLYLILCNLPYIPFSVKNTGSSEEVSVINDLKGHAIAFGNPCFIDKFVPFHFFQTKRRVFR